MKKKFLSLTLAIGLLATAAIGGTLAYFSDSDFNENVMTTGNVKIDQIEQQRTDDGKELEDFVDDKKLVPYIGTPEYEETLPEYTDCKVFKNENNAVDKIVTVKNKGTEEAYIRTLFAFEMEKVQIEGSDTADTSDDEFTYQCPAASKYNRLGLVLQTGGNQISLKGDTDQESEVIIEVDGVKYRIGEYYYQNDSKLAAGETSHPSLTQIYLAPSVGNEWYDRVGEEYSILVLSQATQTQGFADAKTALNTAFGDINEMYKTEAGKAELTKWFSETVSRDESADPEFVAVTPDDPAASL